MSTYYEVLPAEPPCAACGHHAPGVEPLRIGVSAIGWLFSFAVHESLGLRTEEDWRRYLVGRTIRDEYGRPVPTDTFWALVDGKRLRATRPHP